MKSITSLLLFLSLTFLNVSTSQGQAHEKGNLLVSPFIGLGNWGYYVGSYAFPIGVNVDFAIHEFVDIGPYAGIVFNSNYSGINFGVRGNFNWWQLLDNHVDADLKSDVLDIYYTLGFGYEVFSGISRESRFFGRRNSPDRFRVHSAMGVRWYFTEKIALMAEIGGPSIAPAHIGVTFKLR